MLVVHVSCSQGLAESTVSHGFPGCFMAELHKNCRNGHDGDPVLECQDSSTAQSSFACDMVFLCDASAWLMTVNK